MKETKTADDTFQLEKPPMALSEDLGQNGFRVQARVPTDPR